MIDLLSAGVLAAVSGMLLGILTKLNSKEAIDLYGGLVIWFFVITGFAMSGIFAARWVTS